MNELFATCPDCGQQYLWDWDTDEYIGAHVETFAAQGYTVQIVRCDCGEKIAVILDDETGSDVFDRVVE